MQEVASLARDLVSARSRPQQHLGPGLVRAAGQRMDGQREEVAAPPSRLPVPMVRSTQTGTDSAVNADEEEGEV